MRVYLDNCSFNRPFDDQTALSVYLETMAKLGVQTLIKTGILELVWSDILDYENGMNPNIEARDNIFLWRSIAQIIVHQNSDIRDRAKQLQICGLKSMDALHLSCAIEAHCDYFITVDKGILKKKNAVSAINPISPVDFISIWEEQT
ncbi:MAG: hypothetical protein PHQ75_15050 [Thermoguttaceae bacterium]|nr:hypothetical protein [Thermoguttaceae bacterium]